MLQAVLAIADDPGTHSHPMQFKSELLQELDPHTRVLKVRMMLCAMTIVNLALQHAVTVHLQLAAVWCMTMSSSAHGAQYALQYVVTCLQHV